MSLVREKLARKQMLSEYKETIEALKKVDPTKAAPKGCGLAKPMQTGIVLVLRYQCLRLQASVDEAERRITVWDKLKIVVAAAAFATFLNPSIWEWLQKVLRHPPQP